MANISRTRVFAVLGWAVALTTAAEIFYLLVWGMWLFPAGSLTGKAFWTLTCGLAMGAVIGGATLLWAEGRLPPRAAFVSAAAIVTLVGSYCAVLCSRIDAKFGYFGGAEHTALFIWSGVIPAVLGGLLYGWLTYGRQGPAQHRVG